MEIADAIAKEKFLRSYVFPGRTSRKDYEEMSWKDIVKVFGESINESLKTDHLFIFEIVLPILQKVEI